jgi:The GLUG motif.
MKKIFWIPLLALFAAACTPEFPPVFTISNNSLALEYNNKGELSGQDLRLISSYHWTASLQGAAATYLQLSQNNGTAGTSGIQILPTDALNAALDAGTLPTPIGSIQFEANGQTISCEVSFNNTMDGSQANPILVFTSEGMKRIALGTPTKYYVLMADLVLENWLPIGDNSSNSAATRFTGNFNGNGHTITIKSFSTDITPDRTYYHYGLFGCISTTTSSVQSLRAHLSNTSISNDSEDATAYIGGIAGSLLQSTIKNCAVTGELSIDWGRDIYTGGLAGSINTAGKIEYCYSTVNIDAEVGAAVNYVGGIAGHNGGTGEVISCVALNSALSGSVPYRIVGSNSATLTNHYGRTGMTGARTNGSDAPLFNGTDCDAQPTQEWWKTAATWAGGGSAWNFNTIWEFKDGYPKLRNMPVFKN